MAKYFPFRVLKVLTFEEARKLLHEKLKNKPNVIAHSEVCAEVAWEAANKIKKKHPRKKLNPELARLLGLLHDIGRARDCGPKHPFEGRKLLEELGEPELGRSIARHGYSYELEREKDYLPQTLEEKIMNYADCCATEKRVHHSERARDWRERHKNSEDFEIGCACYDRMSKVIREVEKLME